MMRAVVAECLLNYYVHAYPEQTVMLDSDDLLYFVFRDSVGSVMEWADQEQTIVCAKRVH